MNFVLHCTVRALAACARSVESLVESIKTNVVMTAPERRNGNHRTNRRKHKALRLGLHVLGHHRLFCEEQESSTKKKTPPGQTLPIVLKLFKSKLLVCALTKEVRRCERWRSRCACHLWW